MIELLVDTDPGIDDALAICLAFKSFKIRLISCVAGNVSLEKTTLNALKLQGFLGSKIPVAKGCESPLLEPFIDAANIHGESGLEGFSFDKIDEKLLLKKHALEGLKDELLEKEASIMAIGPLTNIALLLAAYPQVKSRILKLVLMGGALGRGNKGVFSEFNFATDPEAAKMVFNSGLKPVMLGLELGEKAALSKKALEEIRRSNEVGSMLYDLFKHYRSSTISGGLKVYDALAFAYLHSPQLFTIQECFVDVETQGLARGASVVDLKGIYNLPANAKVATDIDALGFEELIISCIKDF